MVFEWKKIVSIMLIFAMMTVTVSCSKNDNKSEKNIVPDKETAIENVDTNGNNIEFVAQGDYFITMIIRNGTE